MRRGQRRARGITATHPAAMLERRERDDRDHEQEGDAAHVLARLDEEAEEDGDA